MTKILDGRELAGYIKERQASEVCGLTQRLQRAPKLLIIQDGGNPVVDKYVELKICYGDDVGVETERIVAHGSAEIAEIIKRANGDVLVDGVILQLPIEEKEKTDELTSLIALEKDVDGLSGRGAYESATATAIWWLLTGYTIKLDGQRIAVVGRGKLVGKPIYKILKDAGCNVEVFHRGSDLTLLCKYDVIITATGVPGLITDEMVGAGAVVVDAGTASENGILVGDVAPEVRERSDLMAITPMRGGVGPMTVACLFEHVIMAAKERLE